MYIPEKIYLPYKDGKVIGLVKETGVPYKSGVDGNIEYTRTDVFIENVQLFLIDKLKEIPMGNGKMKIKADCSLEEFINDFKNYMKGE